MICAPYSRAPRACRTCVCVCVCFASPYALERFLVVWFEAY